ncbi:MAG: hypothetical protein MK171_07665 [Pirellulales bacterium]|nr:hypothetical protein [Pirellulales bacterium]
MSTAYVPLKMPKRVHRKMRYLRWLVRLYVGLEGLAAVVLVLGLAFWLGLALDWTFEPKPALRLVGMLVVLGAVGYVAQRFLFSRATAELPNTRLALLVERKYPELQQGLVTTVEAAQQQRTGPVGNRALLRQTSQHASEAMSSIYLLDIFHYRPLIWKLLAALTIVASVAAFAVLRADAFGFWLTRLQLSSAPWPRQVELSVVGFRLHEGGLVANVARDDDFELRAFASIVDGHSVPELVEVRYTLLDSRRGRHAMTQVGEAVPGREKAQEFHFRFKNITEDMSFDVVGGDGRVRGLRLHVVERPRILRMVLECQYPSYMQRSSRSVPFRGRAELPEGTRAVCRVEANKALRSVVVHEPARQQDLPVVLDSNQANAFSFPLAMGPEDRVFLVNMHDQDDVASRDPYRVVISAVVDQVPEVSVRLRGIGVAVTSQARIPFVGRLTDQYGIEEIWYELQVDEDAPVRRTPATQPAGRLDVTQLDPLDLAQEDGQSPSALPRLLPGQKVALAVQARDAYNLDGQMHVGSSQRFLLDIVTDSELRALLEKRELRLRQRFESIYEKMLGIQDLLGRVEITSTASEAEGSVAGRSASANKAVEGDDRMGDHVDESPAEAEFRRRRERDRLRLAGSLQNVAQLAYETLGVAEGFEDIVVELSNNRVDTKELRRRLIEGISEPLQEIGADLMPTLEEQIQAFQATLARDKFPDVPSPPLSNASTERAQRQVIAQSEVVLEAMQQVLGRMLELESYNELVELLRAIVSEHQQLHEQTRDERRKRLRSLLNEE